MGVRTFITEAGHYHPDGPAPTVAYYFREDVWKRTVATVKELARIAGAHDATVLMEPYFQSFFASAKRTRVFLEEIGSPRIRALLDPANLLELNDLDNVGVNELYVKFGSAPTRGSVISSGLTRGGCRPSNCRARTTIL